MILTIEQYNDLFKYCEKLIKSKSFFEKKQVSNFDPADLANETFVLCSEKGDIDEKAVNNIAYGIFMNEWQKSVSKLSYNDSLPNTTRIIIEDTKVCNKCKVPYHISFFQIGINKNGYNRTWCICKNCQNRSRAEYYLKNKEKCLLYNKEWQRDNKAKVQKKCKQYWEREISALSDMYIQWMLRNHDKIPQETIDAYPRLVEEKRQKILLLRKGNKRAGDTAPKMVVKITMNGDRIAAFKTLSAAGRDLGHTDYGKRIGEVLAGKRNHFMGYKYEHWQ